MPPQTRGDAEGEWQVDRCPRCGADVPVEAPQCQRCGLRRVATHVASPPPRTPRLGTLVLVVLCLMLSSAIAVGAGLWYFNAGPFGDQPVSGPSPAVTTVITTVPTPTAPTSDFATVYARVQSGVGLILATNCQGLFTGSGFLIDSRTMATAAHVVSGATAVSVEFGGKRQPAEVVGVAPTIDVAVLSLTFDVDGHVFKLADEDPQPGTHVAAIGFPLDEPKSLTEGTVSGLGRDIATESGEFHGLMQTDTAINPGSSGGPLVDIRGQVVGLADAIRTDAQGIGFAVPPSLAGPALVDGVGLQQPKTPACTAPVATGVRRTLEAYFDAINSGDYHAAMRQLSGAYRAQNFSKPRLWYAAFATSHDDRLKIESVSGPAARPRVWATFRSQQDPGYGPAGARSATCLLWSVDYGMLQRGERWIIDSASGHTDPPYRLC
jgi:S1-C subfamily serine protease